MKAIKRSPAFYEFLQKRCEEITSNDKAYDKLNKEILALEDEIRSTISGDLFEKFIKYEEKVLELIDYTEVLLYRQGWSDSKHL